MQKVFIEILIKMIVYLNFIFLLCTDLKYLKSKKNIMKRRTLFLIFLFLLCSSIGVVNGQSCRVRYNLNPKSFLDSTELLRKQQNYDEIIRIIRDKIKDDSIEIWPYYQLACTYSLKGDTILPFQYLYKYIDLKEFAEDVFSDSDFDKLLPTFSWKCLKDTICKVYLSKYPNISNPELSIKLWEYGIQDQMYRTFGRNNKREITVVDTNYLKEIEHKYINGIEEQSNLVYCLFKENIIPTYSLVGKEASNSFLLIINHIYCKKLTKRNLKSLYKAAINKEIDIEYYIMIHDYWLIQKGKKQLYGTQVGHIVEYDKKGNMVNGKGFFSPIEDEKNVNKRRLELGLHTIEEYAKHMNVDYKYDPEYDKLSTNKAYEKLRERNDEARKQLKKEIEESSK